MHSQHHKLRFHHLRLQAADTFDAAHAGHINVHQNDGGVFLRQGGKRSFSVFMHANDALPAEFLADAVKVNSPVLANVPLIMPVLESSVSPALRQLGIWRHRLSGQQVCRQQQQGK